MAGGFERLPPEEGGGLITVSPHGIDLAAKAAARSNESSGSTDKEDIGRNAAGNSSVGPRSSLERARDFALSPTVTSMVRPQQGAASPGAPTSQTF